MKRGGKVSDIILHVAVGVHHIVIPGREKSVAQCCPVAEIFDVMDNSKIWILQGKFIRDFPRCIRTSVFDDDNFKRISNTFQKIDDRGY